MGILAKSKVGRRVLFIFLFLLLAPVGCGTKPPPEYSFGKAAISIGYQADKKLNFIKQKSHSLVVVVYQLSDVNAFNTRLGYRDGLVELLSATSFDPSVTAVSKHYIEPGANGEILLDRAAHTEHVGIVCGYYTLQAEKLSLLLDVSYETSRHGWTMQKKTTINPLKTSLYLGEDSLRVVEEKDES